MSDQRTCLKFCVKYRIVYHEWQRAGSHRVTHPTLLGETQNCCYAVTTLFSKPSPLWLSYFPNSNGHSKDDVFLTIRGLSEKYRAYLYISALALFFIIGRVSFFKVIPTWLDNTVPAMFPLLETVLELTFRDGLEYARRIHFNRRFVIESLSFEWVFEFWKQPIVTGGYVGNVRRLWKQCDTVFTQNLLHKIRWIRWRVIVVKKPVTVHTRVIPKILFKISQTVVFGIPRLFSSSRTVNGRSPSIASRTRSILSQRCDVLGTSHKYFKLKNL